MSIRPGQYQPILAVDHPVGRPAVIPPDKRDPVVGKGDVDVPPISVASPAALSQAMTQSALRITVVLTDCPPHN